MAKVLNTYAAIERYDLRRDEVDHRLDTAVPEEIKVLHACLLPEEGPWTRLQEAIADATEPVFAHYDWQAQMSACGRYTKVFLPEPFDTEHPKACP